MRWLFVILIALQAASCGQSGPLVLPERTLAPQAISGQIGGREL